MHGQWTVPLVLLLVPGIRSEAYPETARICTYEDSHGNTPNEMNCRETLAGGLQCRDLSKCREEGMDCSDSDVARRVGMTCAGWPGWNGGWPISALHWDDENEYYECNTLASPGGTSDFCRQWITLEDSHDEWEAGQCWCTHERTDNERGRAYCGNWTCEQLEVDKCKEGRLVRYGYSGWRNDWQWGQKGWTCGGAGQAPCSTSWLQSRSPGFEYSRSGDWDRFPYQCICTRCDENGRNCYDYVCGPEVEVEKADCSCLEVTSQGVCRRWYCREYDDAGLHDVEHEYYTASSIGSTGRVNSWRGDIDSRGEFEMSECNCVKPSANGKFCVQWECYEKGMA